MQCKIESSNNLPPKNVSDNNYLLFILAMYNTLPLMCAKQKMLKWFNGYCTFKI